MFSSNENNSGTVPAFLSKLWMLVEDRTYDDLISWGMNGRSFHVHDQVRFAKEILPLYFKHNNIASFIRQLNMYGFRKVVNLEQGSLKTEKDDLQFQHNYFVRGQEKLLEMIKRKVPNVKLDAAKLSPEDFGKLLSDVKVWKTKQNHINLKLETMKRQNDALWREVASLRQKHKQQQQIVNKLIQLLITFVQHNRSLTNMKRQLPRMIEEAPETQEAAVVPSKRSRFSKQLSIEENSEPNSQQLVLQGDILGETTESLPSTAVSTATYPPVIQDIQDVMLNKTNATHYPTIVEISDDDTTEHQAKIDNFQLDDVDTSRLLNEDVVLSSSTGTNDDSPTTTEHIGQDLILASPEAEREALAEQLDSIQVDLDDLQGMLSDSSGSYNLDTNTLLSFFGQDTTPSIPSGGWQDTLLNGLEEEQQAKSSNVTGCELIQYTPADLSCWMDDPTNVESDEDDILNTQLNTPEALDKEVELPSSTGKRKSKRPMRILIS